MTEDSTRFPELPIGRRESQGLELKSKAVLEEPLKVAREVAAMLNTHGGEIWIGVRERDEVGVEVEAIDRIEHERRRLRDALLSLVEPSPTHDELAVEVVPTGHGEGREGERRVDGEGVLRVLVQEGRRKPYAHLLRSAYRGYSRRVDSRIAILSRDELAGLFREGKVGSDARVDEIAGAEAKAAAAWNEEVKKGRSILWIYVAPIGLEFRLEAIRSHFAALTADPSASGNRRGGWNFQSEFLAPKQAGPCLRVGSYDEFIWSEVCHDGHIVFRVRLERLERNEGELYPYALVEFPAAALRFAAELLRRGEGAVPTRTCIVAMGLVAVGERTLRAGLPGSLIYEDRSPQAAVDGHDAIECNRRVLTTTELMDAPDRLAWSLVEEVYSWFGWSEGDMPRTLFNESAGQLSLPG